MTHTVSLLTCQACDLLQYVDHSLEGGVTKCPRCAAVVCKHKRYSLDLTLAFTITGLILFVISNIFPIVSFQFAGQHTETVLISAVSELATQGMRLLASLVFITVILVPFVQLVLLLYVFLPMKFNTIAPGTTLVFRWMLTLRPWNMIEIFMLGILVSVVKLSMMAIIIPGIALWSFGLLILVLTVIASSIDSRLTWKKLAAKS